MTITTTTTHRTMAELREANQAGGQHWFSPDTMRFFDSRIETELLDGGYFVTSEQMNDTAPRGFTIRRAHGSLIATIGDHQQYPTLVSACREVTLLQEENSRVTDIVQPNGPTITEVTQLAQLIRGVWEGAKIRRLMPSELVLSGVLRAFTHEGGGFWHDSDGDLRDAFVWVTTDFGERWWPVREMMPQVFTGELSIEGSDQ